METKTETESEIQGRPTLRLGTGIGIHGLEPKIKVKVSTADWVFLWRLWDQATRIDTPVEAVDNYNRFSASLLQKYNIVLKPGEMAEFT
ncbi:MAG: hypothetical protein M1503_03525 [Thaumarchaeota archaeon]|nr:hypothetical protein [Nitrososphaerota archaeon]MCL5317323.1 hypothetical protein [Nitrososphaerota archaeon]